MAKERGMQKMKSVSIFSELALPLIREGTAHTSLDDLDEMRVGSTGL